MNYITSYHALVLEKYPYLYKCKERGRGRFSLIPKQQKKVATFNCHELSHTILSQVPPTHNSLPKLIKFSAVAKYSHKCLYT